MNRLSYILLFLVITNICYAQTDTVFWFGAPDLQVDHNDRPILLRIASYSSSASVVISQPANPSFVPIQINLPANSAQSVDLTPYIDQIENTVINTVSNKGILIKSTSKISCYYDIASNLNGDIFALKGFNALGFKFMIPFQQAYTSIGFNNRYYADFILTATEDNTIITVNPSSNLIGHPANVPFNITLNKGQTYVCRSSSNNPQERPGGTVVTSNKLICISISDDSLYYPGYGCADTAGDQLIPDNNAGQEFVIIKGQLYTAENYYVFALEDNTNVLVNGVIQKNINAGEFYMGTLSAASCYVETSKNCHLFQVSGFGCELGGAIVPALKCTGSTSVSVTRATGQDFFLNIISPPSQVDAFLFNGVNNLINASNFLPVPGTGGQWMYAVISVPSSLMPAGTSARIENTEGKFHVGIIHGDRGSTTRYGFFSDFSKTRFTINNQDVYCKGNDVNITASYNGGRNFVWTDPNGITQNGPQIKIKNFQDSNVGLYTITADAGGCGTVTQTIYLDLQKFNASVNAPPSICINDRSLTIQSATTLNGGDISKYEWSMGDGTKLTGNPVTHQYQTAGNYEISLNETSTIGCLSSVKQTINILPNPVSNINQTICEGDSFLGYNTTGIFSDTLNSVSGCDSVRILSLRVTPRSRSQIDTFICKGSAYLGYTLPGRYIDTLVAVNGCDSVRTINLAEYPLPQGSVSITGNVNFICEGSSVILTASGGNGYQWYLNNTLIQGATASQLEAKQAGTYSVELISQFGCKNTAATKPVFNVIQKPTVDFRPPFGCVGNPVSFTHTSQTGFSGPVRYDWDLGGGATSTQATPTFIYNRGGSYNVKLTITPLQCPQLAQSVSRPVLIETGRDGIRYTDVNTLINTNTSLSARPFGNQYLWQPSVGLNNYTIARPVFNYDKETEYTIRIGTVSGCETVDTVRLRMFKSADIYVPDAFTPNGDGVNDRLDVFLVGIKDLIWFKVFNRWGQLMFETNDPRQLWDGKFKNVEQPLETYVWIAEGRAFDGRIIKKRGQTILVR